MNEITFYIDFSRCKGCVIEYICRLSKYFKFKLNYTLNCVIKCDPSCNMQIVMQNLRGLHYSNEKGGVIEALHIKWRDKFIRYC